MADPYIGQIIWVAFDFAPRGWLQCNGQILPIESNQSLYSILGTTYGGDGRTDFALPDLRGRVAAGASSSGHPLGEKDGEETVTLVENTISHTHNLVATTNLASVGDPANGILAQTAGNHTIYHSSDNLVNMSPTAITSSGGNSSGGANGHENRQPSLVCNYIICVEGTFPPRN